MWRKVTIDDTVPLDEHRQPLVPQSSYPGELWPMLLAKAVCRVLAGSYEGQIGAPEFGEASIVQILTGWVPDTTKMDAYKYVTKYLLAVYNSLTHYFAANLQCCCCSKLLPGFDLLTHAQPTCNGGAAAYDARNVPRIPTKV